MTAHPAAPLGVQDEREGWIRLKLQAGLPLDPTDEAYLASLPADDPLRLCPHVPRKGPSGKA